MAVVVFPTPPFWFAIDIILPINKIIFIDFLITEIIKRYGFQASEYHKNIIFNALILLILPIQWAKIIK
jgi:hypothetical protein